MSNLEIKRLDFNENLFESLRDFHFAKNLWPLVYILSDEKKKEAYIGETTDALSRMKSHLKNSEKKKLTIVHLFASEKFNKSATLDIESNLIKYMSADGKFKLINGNLGIANHEYFQKRDLYQKLFKSVWNELRADGVAIHSLEHLDNSDLFKYSPYKVLTAEQKDGLALIFKNLLDDNFKNTIIEGGAGTGKTILAIFLFKLLNTDNDDFNFKEFGADEEMFLSQLQQLKEKYPSPKMALVVPMSSFRDTLKQVFRNIRGLKASMVIGPAELIKSEYDIVLVDESHRLRRRVNLGAYFGAFDKACASLGLDKKVASELDFVVKQSKKSVLFYDENQSIKPSDVLKEDFDQLKSSPDTTIEYLNSQFRVRGGNGYVNFIDNLLNCRLKKEDKFNSAVYEFKLFDRFENMVSEIKKRDSEHQLSRLVAGYSWPWISKKDKSQFDINIQNVSLKWNSVAVNWVNSKNALNEVGCIHTTQGYDLNYTGLIFGNEISYDKESNQIIIQEENYFDKNGKQSIKAPEELKAFIINIYKTILLRGIRGTYIYVCDDDLREYFKQHIPWNIKEVSSPILNINDVVPYENSVPLYDLNVAAGDFSEVQNIDIQNYTWIRTPNHINVSSEYFACKVTGESMNKIIQNGTICLFQKYTGGSRNGKIVLVEHTSIQDKDFGSGYTVKEYHSSKTVDYNGDWSHNSIVLKPKSNFPTFEPIELKEDELEGFRVIGVFVCVLD